MRALERMRRAVPALAVMAATCAALQAGPATAATAQPAPPAMTVTPSVGLHDGDAVEVRVTGLGAESLMAVYQCDSVVLTTPGDRTPCDLLWFTVSGIGDPFVRSTPVLEMFSYEDADGGHEVHCGDEPGDCAIVAFAPVSNTTLSVPIDLTPGPLAVAPLQQETGFPVRVAVTVAPGSSARLAQCVFPVAPTLAGSVCTVPQPVTLDAEGRADVPFDVVDEIGAPGPTSCVGNLCAVSLFDGAGTLLRAVRLEHVAPSDGPPQLASGGPTTGTRDGARIRVDITGIRNEGIVLAQCDASVATAADVTDGPCSEPLFTYPARRGTGGVFPDVTLHTTIEAVDGSTVHCDRQVVGACVLAVGSDLGNLATLPIGFELADSVVLSPASGLLDGQSVTVEAANLVPGSAYRVMRCAGLSEEPGVRFDVGHELLCDTTLAEAPLVTASPEGGATATIPALQRFTTGGGRDVYCRAQCQVILVQDIWLPEYGVARYSMAEGSLGASPATGLVDDQPVTVTGTDLMSSYDGPTFLFIHIGAWGLGQCGRAVLDDLTLLGIFENCGVPPGGGAVTVPGSTFTATVQVQDTIEPGLGDPVDCRAAADACVLMVGRLEQDGTTSIHTVPVAFAPD